MKKKLFCTNPCRLHTLKFIFRYQSLNVFMVTTWLPFSEPNKMYGCVVQTLRFFWTKFKILPDVYSSVARIFPSFFALCSWGHKLSFVHSFHISMILWVYLGVTGNWCPPPPPVHTPLDVQRVGETERGREADRQMTCDRGRK